MSCPAVATPAAACGSDCRRLQERGAQQPTHSHAQDCWLAVPIQIRPNRREPAAAGPSPDPLAVVAVAAAVVVVAVAAAAARVARARVVGVVAAVAAVAVVVAAEAEEKVVEKAARAAAEVVAVAAAEGGDAEAMGPTPNHEGHESSHEDRRPFLSIIFYNEQRKSGSGPVEKIYICIVIVLIYVSDKSSLCS